MNDLRNLRRFFLHRVEDVTGVSGIGMVAMGVCFPDGTAVVRWLGEHKSTVIWESVADAKLVHGHGGKTHLVWYDEERSPLTTWNEDMLP